jgi:Protein of unknown function (DUF2877)
VQWQALSVGASVDVWTPRTGVVHSGFSGAINLLLDDEMWTVFGASKADSPFGIRLAPTAAAQRFDVPAHSPVHVRGGYVSVDRLVLDCRSAIRWAPTPWGRPAAGLSERLQFVEQAVVPRAWIGSAGMAADLGQALARTGAQADLHLGRTVRRTLGRGPGLTPSGDDVLVGMLAVLACGGLASAAAAEAASRLSSAMSPVLRATTDISRHLLVQAARGLPGRALHELGRVLVEGADAAGLARALAPVLDTGATSGADACLGLTAACRLLYLAPPPAPERPAA